MLTNTEDHTQSLREMKSSFESRACEWLGHTIVTICTHAIPGACRPRRIGNHPYHSTGSVETQRRYEMIGCDTLNPVGYCSSVQRSVHSVWESNGFLFWRTPNELLRNTQNEALGTSRSLISGICHLRTRDAARNQLATTWRPQLRSTVTSVEFKSS